MPPTYQQNKKHIYKYRQTHSEEYKKYNTEYQKEYTMTNKERLRTYQQNRYRYKKESEIFRNILMPEEA